VRAPLDPDALAAAAAPFGSSLTLHRRRVHQPGGVRLGPAAPLRRSLDMRRAGRRVARRRRGPTGIHVGDIGGAADLRAGRPRVRQTCAGTAGTSCCRPAARPPARRSSAPYHGWAYRLDGALTNGDRHARGARLRSGRARPGRAPGRRVAAPGRTAVECSWYFPSTATDPSHAVDFWDVTNRQDWAACESVQRGVASPHFRPGPLAPKEDAVHQWTALVARAYQDPSAALTQACRSSRPTAAGWQPDRRESR